MAEKKMEFPMKSQRDIIDAHPEHYGKWVVVKGFNDNTVAAYGDTHDEADENAKEKGYRTTGKKHEWKQAGMLMYCYAPCERRIRYNTGVNMDMVNGDCEACPVCKHREKE